MTLLDALILGLIQGVTEFLPVSSSGHLALAEALLGSRRGGEGLAFELLLHVATLLAITLHFRRDLLQLRHATAHTEQGRAARRVVLLVVLASIATVALGLPLRGFAEQAFARPELAGVGLLLTSLALASTLLLLARRGQSPDTAATDWLTDLARLRLRDAAAIGLAQGLAVWPGLSRSGSTIVTGLWLGCTPTTAARFSLLISLPAVGGGFLLELRHLDAVRVQALPWAVGFLAALVLGWLSIGWLFAIVRHRALPWFAAYTGLLGLVVLALTLLR